jgi:ring-1,2-phenylacetyl-CoA epoxidase subunit PaaD
VSTTTAERAIWQALEGVPDPEIPAVSVVDMGMVKEIDVRDGVAHIVMLPTFSGCPAIPIIKRDVAQAAATVEGVKEANVTTTFSPPWTPDRISDQGRDKLRTFGLAPPEERSPVLITEIGLPSRSVCPFCGSTNTTAENAFGPTPCRALYYCRDCRNPFEQFKPV